MAPVDTPVSELPIRELSPSDVPRLLDLGLDRGWAPEERKWRLIMTVGAGYGIDSPDDRSLAGAFALTRYGQEIAAIGMVLVAKRFERQGVGRRMMRHALELVNGATIMLHATDAGRPIYEALGFRVTGSAPTRTGKFVRDPTTDVRGVRRAVAADLDAIRRLDLEVFGAARTAVLGQLPSFCNQLVVAEEAGRLVGFAGSWPNVSNNVIGPVIAASTDIAKSLITALAHGIHGEVRTDVDTRNAELCQWLEARGIKQRSVPNYVMVHGADDVPGDLTRRFAPVTVAI